METPAHLTPDTKNALFEVQSALENKPLYVPPTGKLLQQRGKAEVGAAAAVGLAGGAA